MNEPRRRAWLAKYAVEFVVIVVGVFVAVAAESWWSEREGRLLEQDLRDDMIQEFETNIRILESDLANNRGVVENFSRLTTMNDARLQAMSDEALTRDYGQFPQWSGFDPEMGIVQALVESGNLQAISDRTLRLRLSRWSGLLTESKRFTIQATDFQMIGLLGELARVIDDLEWSAEERRRVQSLYRSLAILQRLVVENQERLLDEARSIREFLSSEVR